ncbi:MAG: hypothetical protein ACR2K3_07400 [Nocardioides sp.]
MTTSPNADDPDTEGKAVPPYDGRKESADVGGSEETTKDGARTGGATAPVELDRDDSDDPAATERGEHASPADEQPAADSDESGVGSDPGTTGPAHEGGTQRAEDQP